MNTIETLPKTFTFDNVDYSLEMHITAWDRICLGYVNTINPHESICYVVVEPENESKDIQFYSPDGAYGVAVSLDDAANMLKDFVETRYIVNKNYKPKNFWEWVNTLKRKTGDWERAIEIGKKYYDGGRNVDAYLPEIIKEFNKAKQNL